MATRLTPRQQAARLRKRHPERGVFVKQAGNGNSKRSPQYSTPVGISPALTRILRPQAAFRWILPNLAAITPQYIEMTMRGALAGNHVQQWELFDLMMDTWPELSACYQELVYGVLSKKLIFEPHQDEDEPPDPDAIERHKVVSAALKQMAPNPDRDENDLAGTIKDLLDGWLRGVTVLETIWQTLDDDDFGQIMAPQSTFWVHPVAFGFNADGVLGLRTADNNYRPGSPTGTAGNARNTPPIGAYPFSYLSAQPQPAVLEPFPPHKFLIGIHKAKSGTALGGPLLRPLAWWWVAANFSADWLLNLAQLFGLPFRWATYDPNAPDETISQIGQMLQNMGSAGWAMYPQGTELEFKETGGGRQAEYSPQGTLMDRADRYARLLVLGQTMTGNTLTGGKGGQAFGVVEKDVKQERIDAAGKYACEIINKQLIQSVLLLNYGDIQNAPKIRLLEENEGQFVDAQRDQILQKMGVKFGVDFIGKKYGVPEAAPDEEILEEPVKPSPFGGGGFGNGNEPPPDGEPMQPNESQPGMEQGDHPMASASGAYAPGHPFYGNQYAKLGDWVKTPHGEGVVVGSEPNHVLVSHKGAGIKRVHRSEVTKTSGEHRFPSITQSAEDKRRQLQNQGIQTKSEPPQVINVNVEPAEVKAQEAPQVINVTVEAAKVTPVTKSFTINRADGTVITGEIAASDEPGHAFRGNQWTGGIPGEGTPNEDKKKEIRAMGEMIADKLDFPKNQIDWHEGPPVEFNVGDRKFIRGGMFDPATGRITIDVNRIDNPASIEPIMAHEISHSQFDLVQKARDSEHERITALIHDNSAFKKYFTAGGFARPEALPELKQKFPISYTFSRTFGDSYLNPESGDKMQEMIKEDGISDYSRAYWSKPAVDQPNGLWRATDETLAEVNAWQTTGATHLSKPSRLWEQFSRDIRTQAKRIKHPYQEIAQWEK